MPIRRRNSVTCSCPCGSADRTTVSYQRVYVSKVGLVDFRSYDDVVVELEPGITTFVGRNGMGKTNLVEGIGYAASLSSHRVSADIALVRRGAERALVRVEVQRDGRAVLVEVEIVPGRANRARLNRAPVTRAREVVGILRTVMFAPEDLALVKGDPAERRRFLDDLLSLRQPRFAGVRADYDRILKQRNALLKSASHARGSADIEGTLSVWDEQLATVGAEVIVTRAALVADLVIPASDAYSAVAPTGGDLDLTRVSTLEGIDEPGLSRDDVRALMLAAVVARRREELARGVTLVGPHRDDLLISLGQVPAKGYASHGESWSCALALKLGSYELLRRTDDGGDPVLILDDVFAELDVGRRERLAERVVQAEQVLVTAAVAADVPAVIEGGQRVVDSGTVRRPTDL